jgi:hypothetical protein
MALGLHDPAGKFRAPGGETWGTQHFILILVVSFKEFTVNFKYYKFEGVHAHHLCHPKSVSVAIILFFGTVRVSVGKLVDEERIVIASLGIHFLEQLEFSRIYQ